MSDVSPLDEARRIACAVHLRERLGDRATSMIGRSGDVSFEVYVFGPSATVPYVTVATAGLSDHAQPGQADGDTRVELMLTLPAGWTGLDPVDFDLLRDAQNAWPLNVLKEVAFYAAGYDFPLTPGTAVRFGRVAHANERLPGAVVGPVRIEGAPADLARAQTPAGPVDYLAVWPLTLAELAAGTTIAESGRLALRRFEEAGRQSVVNPYRQSVVTDATPWSAHLLLGREHPDLASALGSALPSVAAELKAGVREVARQVGPHGMRFAISGPLDPALLSDDFGRLGKREAEVREALSPHRQVITVSPRERGEGDSTGARAVMAIVNLLARQDDVVGLWLPHQGHVTTSAQWQQDLRKKNPLFRVHPETQMGDAKAASTWGLAAFGRREVFLHDDEALAWGVRKRIEEILDRIPNPAAAMPEPGQGGKYGSEQYVLHEAEHPVTGEPVLEMRPEPREKRRWLRRGN